jgi:hypothetical protein
MGGRHVLIAAAALVTGLVSQAEAQDKTNFLMSQCAAGNAAACNALREQPAPKQGMDPLRGFMQGRCAGGDATACATLTGQPVQVPPTYVCRESGSETTCRPCQQTAWGTCQ